VKRREFIKYCLAGGVAAGTGLLSYSWLNMKEEGAMRSAHSLASSTNIDGLSVDEANILYLASLAPSGHNTQPWVITIIEPKRWRIGSERTRWLPAVDPDNREMILSIGTFLENLSLAARIQGYEAVIDVIGENNFSSEIAEVRFIKKQMAVTVSDKVIQERRTVRKGFLNSQISSEDQRMLIGNNKQAVFYYPLNSQEGSYISQANLLANKKQATRIDAQMELGDWIRWSDLEASQHQNGLTPESMEMNGLVRWYAKHFLSKADVLSKRFREETIKLVEEQVHNCAGWLIVKSDGSTVEELINAGRVFESTWFRAHEKRIAFHPMTQVLEESPWQKELAQEIGLAGHVQFVVRIGYIKEYLKPVSLRMPISKILVKNPDGNHI